MKQITIDAYAEAHHVDRSRVLRLIHAGRFGDHARLVETGPARREWRIAADAEWPAGKAGRPALRRCRECGCTDARACVVDGVPCHWVEQDLCSACRGAP